MDLQRFLWVAMLATAIGACANTPTRGLPWWPQGPGTMAEHAATPHASPTPRADGHPQASRHGDLLFVSGQIGLGPTAEVQLRAAMDSVMRVLESHGLAISNIVSVTLYLRDIDDLPKADEAYAAYFPRNPPARSVVGVNALPDGSLIQIAVVAGK